MKRVILIRHGDDPPDDRVHVWLARNGYEADLRKPFRGDPLPDTADEIVGTVIYGGKYNVFDAHIHTFLRDEYRWIDACLTARVPMLGICQGAQQIAYRLGAPVGPLPDEPCEFGYYEVAPVEGAGFLDAPMYVTQSHYHMFGIPEGAVHLAGSDAFPNQAFRWGDRVYGLQFHPEVTPEGFRRWQNAPWARYGQPGAQDRATQDRLMAEHDARQEAWFFDFLDRLFLPQAPERRA